MLRFIAFLSLLVAAPFCASDPQTTPDDTVLQPLYAAPPVMPAKNVHPPLSSPRHSRTDLIKLIDAAAQRYGVERALVHAIVRAESNYNPQAVSPAGAIGLMQIMPETAADYGVTTLAALFDPAIKARTGVRHLKRLLSMYTIGQAVMAYNAGEGALERANGFVTYPETQQYTRRVLQHYLRTKGINPDSAEAQQVVGLTVQLLPTTALAMRVRLPSSQATQLMVGAPHLRPRRRIDMSKLSLRLRPLSLDSSVSTQALNPAIHRVGPESKPMFVLEQRLASD